jgi:hypothetical protein
MLQFVDVGPRSLSTYRGIAPDNLLDDLLRLAKDLKGARVVHINATPHGGGPSLEIRNSHKKAQKSFCAFLWLLFPSGEQPAFIQGWVRSCRSGQKKRISFAQDSFDVTGIHMRMTDRDFIFLTSRNDLL